MLHAELTPPLRRVPPDLCLPDHLLRVEPKGGSGAGAIGLVPQQSQRSSIASLSLPGTPGRPPSSAGQRSSVSPRSLAASAATAAAAGRGLPCAGEFGAAAIVVKAPSHPPVLPKSPHAARTAGTAVDSLLPRLLAEPTDRPTPE